MRVPFQVFAGLLAIASVILANCSGPGGTANVAVPPPASPTATPASTPTPTATPTATATPAPTPSPTPVPTSTPKSAALTTNPSALTFNNVGNNCGPNGTASCSQTFTASETSYSGALNASSNNAGVATVTPQGNGPNATFTVNPIGPGTATITVTDANSQSVTVSVTVSTSTIQIHGGRRN